MDKEFEKAEKDNDFCNWFAYNYPEQYKFYRNLWLVKSKVD
jgi:hypothetical protein